MARGEHAGRERERLDTQVVQSLQVETSRAVEREVLLPPRVLEELAADALRYILLREMQFHGDTEYTADNFLKRYNTDLANDLGNLANRSVNMLVKLQPSRIA